MARSSQQKLDDLDSAIALVEAGGVSSYSIGSRSATKLDLPSMYAERARLEALVSRESTGMFRLAKMQRTSR